MPLIDAVLCVGLNVVDGLAMQSLGVQPANRASLFQRWLCCSAAGISLPRESSERDRITLAHPVANTRIDIAACRGQD